MKRAGEWEMRGMTKRIQNRGGTRRKTTEKSSQYIDQEGRYWVTFFESNVVCVSHLRVNTNRLRIYSRSFIQARIIIFLQYNWLRKPSPVSSQSIPSVWASIQSFSQYRVQRGIHRGSQECAWWERKHDRQWGDRPKWERNRRSDRCSHSPSKNNCLNPNERIKANGFTLAIFSSIPKYLSLAGTATSFTSCSLSVRIEQFMDYHFPCLKFLFCNV